MPVPKTYYGAYLWHYVPSQVAAIVFAALFTVITALHGWKMFSGRFWFCLPFFIGGIFEIVGYIGRALAYDHTGDLLPYLIQSIFLILAPVFFAASLYMTYGRCVRAVQGEKWAPISPRWSTRLFVLGDIVTLQVQSSAAGMLAKSESYSQGEHLIVAGLILQIIIFGFFIYVTFRFNIQFRNKGRQATEVPWQACLNMLYVASVMIMVRNFFRMIEFIMGSDGYLQSTEWPVYVFDGTLMLVTMGIFFWWYPGVLKSDHGESIAELANVGEARERRR
ncbi:RTA1-domain-containing protein [Thozetella sp. PMI_491]|nr:RTA1-domain-containing protein [Thozetella sp. PMI_491]